MLEKHADGIAAVHTAHLLDIRACRRLIIGDDRERLKRRLGQIAAVAHAERRLHIVGIDLLCHKLAGISQYQELYAAHGIAVIFFFIFPDNRADLLCGDSHDLAQLLKGERIACRKKCGFRYALYLIGGKRFSVFIKCGDAVFTLQGDRLFRQICSSFSSFVFLCVFSLRMTFEPVSSSCARSGIILPVFISSRSP